MRLLLIFTFITIVLAWSPEDYEIFKLNDKVRQTIGPETTFYTWLNLINGPKSTSQEIKKAYRNLSKSLHPDKLNFKSSKERKKAEEKYAILSSVNNILRDASRKERYDYFIAKGFPKWKSTGYFYSKFRPGLLLTIFFVYLLISLLHFFALKINRKQNFKRIANLKDEIKTQAWGGSKVAPLDGSDRRLTNETGKIFLVKNNGDVFIEDGEETHLIDENEINLNPGFKDSLIFKLPAKLYNLTFGKVFKPIDMTITYNKPVNEEPEIEKKKKKSKGKKLELPNGKIVYSRKK
ncbi:uncharacterized protein KGF55_003393 [Candida pseudojiufengensis]|uniref:uncharacterized protein n=1 Tax=Candida pseudojiufengensis TaxID=497109 RepID=UPI002223FA3E|nr:uncharacterized protein KGF55_003393 [Candida pseudojiufengensis]KAI5962317.1 hypothetical protein KGF55_003393 [Candida pseudojiufengensis]